MFEKKSSALGRGGNQSSKKSVKNMFGGPVFGLLSAVKVILIPAVFAAIVVCILHMSVQKEHQVEDLKGRVLIVKEDTAVNTFVRKGEASKYFEVASVDHKIIPQQTYKSLEELPEDGFYLMNNMFKNQVVLKSDVALVNTDMEKYSGGYEITSFSGGDFYRSVNGSLRKGDIVDIYAIDPATDIHVLMLSDVYISEVYDNAGKIITEPDGVATSFTVWVTPDEVDSLNTAVIYGGIQMYLKEN